MLANLSVAVVSVTVLYGRIKVGLEKHAPRVEFETYEHAKPGEVAKDAVLKMEVSSSTPSIDEAVLALVRRVAPFKKPPNDIPYQKGMSITFYNHRDRSQPSSVGVIAAWPFQWTASWAARN